MKIKSMLARLQHSVGQDYRVEPLILAPGSFPFKALEAQPKETIDLVVGYNGSSHSQAALDLTLWIAHQTRLATQKPVMVHVVYVVDLHSAKAKPIHSAPIPYLPHHLRSTPSRSPFEHGAVVGPSVLVKERIDQCNPCYPNSDTSSSGMLDYADCVLWQARCLAEEWRGSLEAHLRFGDLATELQKVISEKAADVLVLGCSSNKHPLVQQLTPQSLCPVLGIPDLMQLR